MQTHTDMLVALLDRPKAMERLIRLNDSYFSRIKYMYYENNPKEWQEFLNLMEAPRSNLTDLQWMRKISSLPVMQNEPTLLVTFHLISGFLGFPDDPSPFRSCSNPISLDENGQRNDKPLMKDTPIAPSQPVKAETCTNLHMDVLIPSLHQWITLKPNFESQKLFKDAIMNYCRILEKDKIASSDGDVDAEEEEEEEEKTPSRKRKRTSSKPRTFAFEQLKAHRKALSNAWLNILKLDLPTSALKQALIVLPQVLPQVPEALRFSDFLMQAFNNRGVLPILALDGLFILMMQHNLDYPAFYSVLYSLIQPSLLYVKYRTRFFELLTKCLIHNQMLPSHIVAAFCKRLLRISLSAPPPSILFCLALTGNLLRKHPECACLIHRDTALEDAFDAETNDPTKSRALESSLWELNALAHHYYPAVTTLAKSIGTETVTTPMHDLPDFLAHTYKSLFDQERKQSRKKVALTFHEPVALFGEQDVLTGIVRVPTTTNTS